MNDLTNMLIPADANPGDEEENKILVENLRMVMMAVLNLDTTEKKSTMDEDQTLT